MSSRLTTITLTLTHFQQIFYWFFFCFCFCFLFFSGFVRSSLAAVLKTQNGKNISAVSIMVPAFMQKAVDGWCHICQAQFELRHITSEPKILSCYIIFASQYIIKPAIHHHCRKEIYRKDAVLARHERVKPKMFEKLLAEKQMTGRPSTFLHELMLIVNEVGIKDERIRHKFAQPLPSEVRPVLEAVKNATLIKLGTLADEIMFFAKSRGVYHTAVPNTTRYTRPCRERINK